MSSKWRELRKSAGISLHKASADANVTPTTARAFELGGPDAINDPTKRAALVAVWSSFDPLPQAPSAA